MRRTRRTILAGLGSLTAAVAGCTTGTDPSEEQDHTFEDIAVEETALVVELTAGASVEQVNVIAPDGSTFATETVSEGATRVDFQIGTSYETGEYRIVAVQEGESVAEETLEIAPDVRITEVGIGENSPNRMPEDLNFPNSQAFVTIENQGAGTEVIEEMWVVGDIPNPTTEIKNESDSPSGIFDVEKGSGDAKKVEIKSEETVTVFSTTTPFLYTGENVECGSEKGECRFILPVRIRESPLSQDYVVEYTESQNDDSCDIVLTEEKT